MNKPTTNYWVNVIIGIAFVVSGVSGLVFLLPASAGAGGSLVGLSVRTWNNLHTWSSIVMIAGVGVHLALHWKWIVFMTRRKMLSPFAALSGAVTVATAIRPDADGGPPRHGARRAAARASRPDPVAIATEEPAAAGIDHDRRAFLRLGGAATLATGLLVAGYRVGSGGNGAPAMDDAGQGAASGSSSPGAPASADVPPAGASGADASAAGGAAASETAPSTEIQAGPLVESEAEQVQGVACRFGIVDDPYPGQCRHYIDSNGSGICDYSVLGSGNVTAVGSRRG